jgi:class 3 adenylate cyclase
MWQKKLGDALMALFGYPLAHENDAERAARTALSIQRALADLNRKNAGIGKPELKTRIGLETGPVVVDATGEVMATCPKAVSRKCGRNFLGGNERHPTCRHPPPAAH